MIRKYISGLPAVILMVIIFSFSSKPAAVSGESSLKISQTLLNTYENISDQSFEEVIRKEILFDLDHLVRKTAHFVEYAVLAAAWVWHFIMQGKRIYTGAGLSILITSAYAATDEFHQTFVPGRSGQLSDVLLDSCGALTGAAVFLGLVMLWKRYRSRQTAKRQQ